MRMDLPSSCARGAEEVLRNPAFAGRRAGNGLECVNAPDQALPRADRAGEVQHGRRHRRGPRAGRVHVGDRPDGAGGSLIRRERIAPSPISAGARQRQGNSRQRFVAGFADARCKSGPAPDEIMDMRSRPAHQSLFTNVLGRAPTDMRTSFVNRRPRGVRCFRSSLGLTKDIRAIRQGHLPHSLGI